MLIEFWGTRAGVPSGTSPVSPYGGHTACVSIRFSAGREFVIDCGTGVVGLSHSLQQRGVKRVIALFSAHSWDRIQGIPFASILFSPDFAVQCVALRTPDSCLWQRLNQQMEYEFFPIPLQSLSAQATFTDIASALPATETALHVDAANTVRVLPLRPAGSQAAFRLQSQEQSIVHAVHVDWGQPFPSAAQLVDFIQATDLLITNAPATFEAWGNMQHLCQQAAVQRIIISDYLPQHRDATLNKLESLYATAIAGAPDSRRSVQFASAQLRIQL